MRILTAIAIIGVIFIFGFVVRLLLGLRAKY